jgi:hypothetical protein
VQAANNGGNLGQLLAGKGGGIGYRLPFHKLEQVASPPVPAPAAGRGPEAGRGQVCQKRLDARRRRGDRLANGVPDAHHPAGRMAAPQKLALLVPGHDRLLRTHRPSREKNTGARLRAERMARRRRPASYTRPGKAFKVQESGRKDAKGISLPDCFCV